MDGDVWVRVRVSVTRVRETRWVSELGVRSADPGVD